MPLDAMLKDRTFLAKLLEDPERAIKSYQLNVPQEILDALKKAADGEYDHWKAVVKDVSEAKSDLCNMC